MVELALEDDALEHGDGGEIVGLSQVETDEEG
jgi:hypothetical protein